ncbi:MAG: nicotinate phosphoribosyltransferase [Bacteroidales bacterium]
MEQPKDKKVPDLSPLHSYAGLYTDHYELTMAQGYFLSGKAEIPSVFDYFFRKAPFGGNYVVFSGLGELLKLLQNYRFNNEGLTFLSRLGFDQRFLSWLEDFRFRGTIVAMKEGEVVFPYEPSIRIEGSIIEAQLVETLLLNLINFESLIATKAARIREVAGERTLIDFGLRRAHGYGGIQASRAAIVGGFDKTSNVFSAFRYGLGSTGTMAHSWVQSFDDELNAFLAYAEHFPHDCILLVDTYDSLNSGIPNAIRVGLEMEKRGTKLLGIRLDSGDLSYLSKKARKMLDMAGLTYVKIFASNQLDEHVVASLLEQKAPIDGFGVGTALVTGKDTGALDGVYKLSMINGDPTLKVSENRAKTTLPGKKTVYRFLDDQGKFQADAIALEGESGFSSIHHPTEDRKKKNIAQFTPEKLTEKVMEDGNLIIVPQTPAESAAYSHSRLQQLSSEHKRLLYPHLYTTGITKKLQRLRDQLVKAGSV